MKIGLFGKSDFDFWSNFDWGGKIKSPGKIKNGHGHDISQIYSD